MNCLSDRYQCLSCLKRLKDRDLVCSASCDHIIHEWCIEVTNSLAHLTTRCKICDKDVVVHLVFRELDLVRMMQIDSFPTIVSRLEEISNSVQSRSRQMMDLENKLQQVSDKLSQLANEQPNVSKMESPNAETNTEKDEM